MAKKPSGAVELKGYGKDVNIILSSEAAFSDIKTELTKKLEDSDQFLEGVAVVLDAGECVLNSKECEELKAILTDKYNLVISAVRSQIDETRAVAEEIGWTVKEREQEQPKKQERVKKRTEIVPKNDAILLTQTFRSGQRFSHPGSVVIIGDVNPGAEIEAAGDIVVMGTLRGVAHAGAEGDISAKIIALDLRPIQLRIAQYIGRSPDLNLKTGNIPEEARVEDGNIVIRKLK